MSTKEEEPMYQTADNPNEIDHTSPEESNRKEHSMRSKLTLIIAGTALALAAHTATAQNGGGMKAGLATASSTSTVTVTIPGVVGIDIESDVAIDLGSYVAAASGHANGTACPANMFPPPAGCTGAATYAATGSTTTAGAPGAAPAAGNIWMSVFCTKSAGALSLQGQVSAAWAPAAGPGFATTALRNSVSAANNAAAAGNASATAFGTSATSIGVGTLPATFGWTRVDQLIDLAVPGASAVTFAAGAYTTTATFTINKS
jgi:hypothetical protein